MQIVHWYQAWGAADVNASTFDISLLDATASQHATPFITWEPWDETLPVNQKTFPLKSIAAGTYDAYIDSWALGLRGFGAPVMLTFAQEMQGDWYPWGYGVNGNTASDYINAYRHVHDRFALDGATNVQWVWTVDADQEGSPYPDSTLFYPGDGYTDWMGIDAYNFGTTESWSSWQSLSDVLSLTYGRLTALNASKPLVLSEWASAESGGSKPNWLQATVSELEGSFPRVRAAVWFNEHGTQWALDSTSQSLTAAGQAFRGLQDVRLR
jgi:beta-mannanase